MAYYKHCPVCEGRGKTASECPHCDGYGCPRCGRSGYSSTYDIVCLVCSGTGMVEADPPTEKEIQESKRKALEPSRYELEVERQRKQNEERLTREAAEKARDEKVWSTLKTIGIAILVIAVILMIAYPGLVPFFVIGGIALFIWYLLDSG